MIIKMVCWMKSGVQIEESIEFIKETTIEDAEKAREEMNGLIRNVIRRNDSGTINFGFASFNISEIAAYRMTIEDVEESEFTMRTIPVSAMEKSGERWFGRRTRNML